jgi:hypothetical protein
MATANKPKPTPRVNPLADGEVESVCEKPDDMVSLPVGIEMPLVFRLWPAI